MSLFNSNLCEFVNEGHFTHETESPWPLHFKHAHWWKRWSRSKFDAHYTWGTNGVYMWMQDGWKVYINSYMASNGSCFKLTWTILNNQLSEVGLTQNMGTMALQTLTTIGLFYVYHVWGPAWREIHWNSIWLRTRSHVTSHLHLRVHDHLTTRVWTCLGTVAFEHSLSFGLSQFLPWSRLLACVWRGLGKQWPGRTGS